MDEDTEYSDRYQTWPDAVSAVKSPPMSSLSTTIKYWMEHDFSVSDDSQIIWQHVVDNYRLISSSAAISHQLFHTCFRWGLIEVGTSCAVTRVCPTAIGHKYEVHGKRQLIVSKNSIDTRWNSIFCRTESDISFSFIQRMVPFSVAWVAKDLNILQRINHYLFASGSICTVPRKKGQIRLPVWN